MSRTNGPDIDNRWYDMPGEEWWDPRGRVALLQQMNPLRVAYFHQACARTLGRSATGGGDVRGGGVCWTSAAAVATSRGATAAGSG